MTPTEVKQLQSSQAWQSFEYHVRSVAKTLDSLAGITFTDPTASSIEGRARQLAKEKLQEILEPFMSFSNTDDEEKDKTTKDAGL